MKSDLDQTRQHDSEQDADILHQQHDASYKFLLSSKKLFVELLHSFINKQWVQEIVEDQVEQIPHSFVAQDFRRQEADVVYRVDVQGQEVLFYVLVELQSTVDYRMPYRLLVYQIEIWRYWLHNRKQARKNYKSFNLPPIVPIVLYNGKQSWTAKRQFRHLLKKEAMFGSELLNFEYVLIDVNSYSEKHLLALSNTLSAVFLLDQKQDREQLLARLGKLLNLFKHLPEEEKQKFFAWVSRILMQKLPDSEPSVQKWLKYAEGEESTMGFEQFLDDIEQKGVQIGKEQGVQIGKEQGMQIGEELAMEKIAKQMLAEQLDVALIAKITGFSVEKIERLRQF